MSLQKIVAQKYSDGGKLENFEEDSKRTDDSFKTLHFKGLIVQVRPSKVKKATGDCVRNDQKNSTPSTTKNDENKPPNVNSSSTSQSSTQSLDSKLPNVASENFILIEPRNELNGAAGLLAQNSGNIPEQELTEPSTEVPAVTEEDLVIIRQFMEAHDDNAEIVKNKSDFICSICNISTDVGDGVVLKGCSHQFCENCLTNHIHNNFDELGQVKCPLKLESCENYVFDEEVRGVLGNLYEDFTLKVMKKRDDAIQDKERQNKLSKFETLADLLNAENHDLIETSEEFECSVCFWTIKNGDGLILKNCLHSFCKDCVVNTIEHSDNFVVKCPEDGCEFCIQEREIRGLVSAEVFDKHLELSIKVYEGMSMNSYHCKTPDCKGFILNENNAKKFTCEVCLVENCINCKVIHVGKTCHQYADEINPEAKNQRENAESENAIKTLIASGEAMNCPRCEIPVMKQEGCDFLKCLTCQLAICWRTKRPRHPMTKPNGVIIDGCHCKEKGILCHPQCQNCH